MSSSQQHETTTLDFALPTISNKAIDLESIAAETAESDQDQNNIIIPTEHQHKDIADIKLSFRTYQPYSKDLKPFQKKIATQMQDFEWINEETDKLLADAIHIDDDDFISKGELVKKPTWDLKRDIEPQMNLISQKTQQSIAVLMQHKFDQK